MADLSHKKILNLPNAALAFFAALLFVFSFWNAPQAYRVFYLVEEGSKDIVVQPAFFSSLPVIFLNYLIICLLGYGLARFYFKNIQASLTVKFLAAFYVGFLGSLGIFRVVSLVAYYRDAYWPCMLSVIVLTFVLFLIAFLKKDIAWKGFETKAVAANAGWLILFAVLFVGVLILQIRQGDFEFVGHGKMQYSYLLDLFYEKFAYFPIITQQHDEILFHAIVAFPFRGSFETYLIWWLTLGLIKISCFAFVYLSFKKLGFQSVFSFVATGFLLVGTYSLVFYRYYLFFDSSNPLLYAVHAGRIVGIMVVFFIVIDHLSTKLTKEAWPFYFLVPLGLTFTSISNTLWLMAVGILIVIFRAEARQREETHLPARDLNAVLICYGSVVGGWLLYALPFDQPQAYLGRTAIICGLVVVIVFRIGQKIWKGIITQSWDFKSCGAMGILVLGSLVGLCLFANLFADNPIARKVIQIKNDYSQVYFTPLPRGFGHEIEPQEGTLAVGDYRENEPYDEHGEGLLPFNAYYGGILFFIICVHWLYQRRPTRTSAEVILYELFLICAGSLPLLLFFMDFLDYGTRAWVKSRFLEVPVYFIVFSFLYGLGRLVSEKVRVIISIILIIYIVLPFIASQRPAQIQYNWRTFQQMTEPRD